MSGTRPEEGNANVDCPLCGQTVPKLPQHLRGGCPENAE